MKPGKYYDRAEGRPLDEADGCPWPAWADPPRGGRFARGPQGVLVFLPADRVSREDKYAQGVFDAEADESTPFHQMRLRETLHLLERWASEAKPPERLLDLACGTGAFLEAVGRRFPQAERTGLDLSLRALEAAAARNPSAEFVLADGRGSPFATGYFDAVLLNNVIEHLPDPASLIGEAARVLAPGGCLVLSTPSRYRLENLLRVARGNPVVFMSRDHVTEYSVGQVEELLRQAGFGLLEVRGPARKPGRRTLRNTLSGALLKPVLRGGLSLCGSHHVLESTAFFLARREPSVER